MKILLTGATGYIGCHIAHRISCSKYKLYCLLREKSNEKKIIDIKCSIIRFSYNMELYSILKDVQPDCIIHLAGLFVGEHSEDNILQMIDSNLSFSTILIDAADKAGCKHFLNTGTYWQNYNGEKYSPVNLYAATKEAFENILQYYVEVREFRVITLQLFDTFGENDPRNKVLNIVARLNNGESIAMSPGLQKMYFCYIKDVVQGYMKALELLILLQKSEYHKYALRDEIPMTLQDIVNTYIEVTHKEINITWGGRSYRNREIIDPTGIGDILPNWKANYSIKEAMEDIYCEN